MTEHVCLPLPSMDIICVCSPRYRPTLTGSPASWTASPRERARTPLRGSARTTGRWQLKTDSPRGTRYLNKVEKVTYKGTIYLCLFGVQSLSDIITSTSRHLLVNLLDIVTIFPNPKSQFQYCSPIAL